jgi:methylamine---glutamate N-methyltransferase subunit C
MEKIAETRGLAPGQDAISPATFDTPATVDEFRKLSDEVRERSGGIPVGYKLSANHIEDDIDFALDAGADYIILDGRGGGTGAAPLLFRDHISVPTIPALARARRHLDRKAGREVTLIITGGLRMPEDFIKAMALGADGIALSNSALQAIGCVAARMCNTNLCPAGIATQKPELRQRLDVAVAAKRLATFFEASVHLMQVMARACGHDRLAKLCRDDLTTWKREMADLSGVRFGGVGSNDRV